MCIKKNLNPTLVSVVLAGWADSARARGTQGPWEIGFKALLRIVFRGQFKEVPLHSNLPPPPQWAKIMVHSTLINKSMKTDKSMSKILTKL